MTAQKFQELVGQWVEYYDPRKFTAGTRFGKITKIVGNIVSLETSSGTHKRVERDGVKRVYHRPTNSYHDIDRKTGKIIWDTLYVSDIPEIREQRERHEEGALWKF